jgi:hypothetical protein
MGTDPIFPQTPFFQIPKWGQTPFFQIPKWGQTPFFQIPKWGLSPICDETTLFALKTGNSLNIHGFS